MALSRERGTAFAAPFAGDQRAALARITAATSIVAIYSDRTIPPTLPSRERLYFRTGKFYRRGPQNEGSSLRSVKINPACDRALVNIDPGNKLAGFV